MAIKNLTDSITLSKIGRQIPIAGKFWKGAPKEGGKWGKDLDGEWRIELNEGFEYIADAIDMIIPDTSSPIIIATYNHLPQEVLNDYYRLYGSNNVAKIVCDGEKVVFTSDNTDHCMNCPIKRDEAQSAKEKAKFCAPMGYFRFMIPQLNKALLQPLAFQFDVTSDNELQQFASELNHVFSDKGTLVNKLFILRRNNRTFNRNGQQNTKSLAYLIDFNVELDEKITQYHQIESGETQAALPASQSQLPSGNPDDPIADKDLSQPTQESQANQRQKYLETVTDWLADRKRFEIDLDAILFQLGSFSSIEQLIDEFPNQTDLENHIIQELCIKSRRLVKIYGVRTEQYRNNARMIIPFGMGMIYSYTREDFGDHSEVARRGYGEPDKNGKYPKNIGVPGDHAFQHVFGLEHMSMELGLTDTGNLKIVRITGDSPF